MSFIRHGQESQYVDLHDGSQEYIYDHGSGIHGFGSYGEFIHALCAHAENAGLSIDGFQRALENHYVESREETQFLGPKAEMAHIIAQHLDSRLDGLTTLTEERRRSLDEYAQETFYECPECDELWRPTPFVPDDQGETCRDCYEEQLQQMDVSADLSDVIEYLEEVVPDDTSPTRDHDDEFYALCMEVFMPNSSGTEEDQALHHQLGRIADEMMDAHLEERHADKEWMLEKLNEIHNDG